MLFFIGRSLDNPPADSGKPLDLADGEAVALEPGKRPVARALIEPLQHSICTRLNFIMRLYDIHNDFKDCRTNIGEYLRVRENVFAFPNFPYSSQH